MGFGWIIAGLILLVNPIIQLYDILPDCIGFLCIAKGLSKLSYMNSRFENARTACLRLSLTELIRLLCIVFLPYSSSTVSVLFAFTFGVIELILFIPFAADFFEGFSSVCMMYSCKARVNFDRTMRFTVVFYIVRVLFTFLPEITELQDYENTGLVSSYAIDYTRFKPLFYVALGFIGLIIGIIWLICTIRFLCRIKNDKAFLESLSKTFEEDIKTKKGLFIGKKMKTVFILYILSVLLSLCLYLDNVNVLPGILSAAVLSAATLLAGKYDKKICAVLPFCLIRAVLSIFGCINQQRYYNDFIKDYKQQGWSVGGNHSNISDYVDVAKKSYEKIPEAAELYDLSSLLLLIENIAALCAFAFFIIFLSGIIKKHVANSGVQNDSVQYNKANRDAEVCSLINRKLIFNGLMMIINFLLAGFYLNIMLNNTAIFVINIGITLLWLLHTVFMVSAVNNVLYTPLENEER